ncbi:hypothetical protein TNCV_4327191 [Trichonephila clavipes]|nr:hypothetical protein TNCV_4327191 [Trichonephila clavipes]
MAERSKALRSGRSPLVWAWVRIPHLTMYFFQSFFEVKNFMQGKAILRVRMVEWSKALRSGRSPLLWAWSFFEVKNYMQEKAILRVRIAEWSKALRSGRSPLLWAWETLSHVSGWPSGQGAAFRSQSNCVGVGSNPTSDNVFLSVIFEVKKQMQEKAILRVRIAEWSKALRSGRSPLLWAWVKLPERSKALRLSRRKFCRRGFGFHV